MGDIGTDIYARVRSVLLRVVSNPVSLIGAVFVIGGLILLLFFTITYTIGTNVVNPYYGTLGFLGLPLVIGSGAFLVLLGWVIFRGKAEEKPFWAQQFSIRSEKRALLLFGALVAGCMVFLGITGMQAATFMDSTSFCGGACHSVMEPEAVAHANSVHSSVKCVQCHVGEGVQGTIVAKWRGTWQVFAVITGHFKRPVHTPVETLPSSEDTCQHCHNVGVERKPKIKVYKGFKEDEESTPVISAVLMNVRTSSYAGLPGMHSHMSDDLKIRFYSEDGERKRITWVEAIRNGESRAWSLEGESPPEIEMISSTSKGRRIYMLKGEGEMREMDCVDCHNRIGHGFPPPEKLADDLLLKEVVHPRLPYAKKTALKALMAAMDGDKETMAERITSELYAAWPASGVSLEDMAEEISKVAKRYLYPGMNIGWNTYTDLNGHSRDAGCFRCHNQRMRDGEGNNLSQDCDSCHATLADGVEYEAWEKRMTERGGYGNGPVMERN